MPATNFRHAFAMVIASAALLPVSARADLNTVETGFTFKNNTKVAADDLEIRITSGKFHNFNTTDPNLVFTQFNPQNIGRAVRVTGFNLAAGDTLKFGIAFDDFDGKSIFANWTSSLKNIGNIPMFAASVDTINAGGGSLIPDIVIGNEDPSVTLAFTGSYAWVPSFFDVFVDPLPVLTALPGETVAPGGSFTFANLNSGPRGDEFLLAGTVADSAGDVQYSFDSVFSTVPEPSALILLATALLLAIPLRSIRSRPSGRGAIRE